MPVVNIAIGPIDKSKKKEIIENVTKTLSEATGIPEQGFTVLINEIEHDNVGVGGQQLSEMMEKNK